MGTTQRHEPWKFGDANPRESQAAVSGVAIAKGDLVAMAQSGGITGAESSTSIAAGKPYPADEEPWTTDLATTQENFHDQFTGVSHGRSRSADVLPLVYGTSGVYEFDCAAATFEEGDLVGPAKQAGNQLEAQKVVAVATANLAIGRVAKPYTSNTTKVLVEIVSSIHRGGPQAVA